VLFCLFGGAWVGCVREKEEFTQGISMDISRTCVPGEGDLQERHSGVSIRFVDSVGQHLATADA